MIEALIDLGVDMRSEGLEVPLEAQLGISVSDLSLNYQPAIRCRATTRQVFAAGGAGNYAGMVVRSPSSGMWLLEVTSVAATGIIVYVTLNAFANFAAGWVNQVLWCGTGDAPGEVRAQDALIDFGVGDATGAKAGNLTAFGPGVGMQVNATTVFGGAFLPLWIPALSNVVFHSAAGNQSLDLSVCVQFAAQNTGRLP